MDEWHIGDPVDWGDGFMDAQKWGRTTIMTKKIPMKAVPNISKR